MVKGIVLVNISNKLKIISFINDAPRPMNNKQTVTCRFLSTKNGKKFRPSFWLDCAENNLKPNFLTKLINEKII